MAFGNISSNIIDDFLRLRSRPAYITQVRKLGIFRFTDCLE
jgi:hypothetical protein